MAGTIAATTPNKYGKSLSAKYDVTLTLSAGGAVSGIPVQVTPGYLVAVDTIPSTPAPTDGYTLTLLNADGVDVLNGSGATRSDDTNQRILMKPSIVDGPLYPTIASGGNGAVIRLIMWVQGA